LIISLIVASDKNRGIGRLNALPWHLSTDLIRFKRLTTGHHMIMGRKTWQSIGQPLPGRTSIVVSRDPDFNPKGCIIASSLEDAILIAENAGENEVFIIGGGEVFLQTIDKADCLYITEVQMKSEADVHFPIVDNRVWKEIYSESPKIHIKDEYASAFKILVRNDSPYAQLLISKFAVDNLSIINN
jgi:dihydrofolate reductase